MCIAAAFHQSASSCASPACLLLLFYIHIDCNCIIFPQCASWCAFWELKPGCMKSCTVCTCAVSPQSERGSELSSNHSWQMICCTVCSCISSPHCGSSCDWKGCPCSRMYSDTSHKIFVRTSSIVKSTLSWWPLITEINLIGTNLIIVLWLGSLFLSTNMSRNLLVF